MRRFVSLLAASISLLGMHVAPARADTRIFRADGTLQCGMGEEVPLAADKALVERLGARVISSEKRELPMAISQLCGAPTGRVNTFVISDADWTKILRGFVGPLGFARWVFDNPTVEVYKYDGTLQCGLGRKLPPEEMAHQLSSAGVNVINARSGTDGLRHMQLCGASTGAINIFEIPSVSFQSALTLGFRYYRSRADRARDLAAMRSDAPLSDTTPASTPEADEGPEVPFPY